MAEASAPSPLHSSAPAPVTSSTLISSTAVDVTRLLYMLYQDVESQINRADLKAQITLSTSAILAAMVSNIGLGLKSPDMHLWTATEWTLLGIYALFIAFICCAIAHALLAAFPRSIGKSKKKPENANLYFTADIVTLHPETYVQLFGAQLNSDVRENVLKQIHAKGRVLEAKLGHVRWGLKFLSLGMLIWLLARVFLVASYARLPVH
ncbi:MAG: Pycsar system effector family protein [Verrucomicrobiota bacterium]